MSIWLITGASRGFGRELTAAALAAGHSVVATARDFEQVSEHFPDAGDSLLAVPLDVTDPQAAEEAVRLAVERFERIDVVVDNAGYGLFGSVEETTDEQVRALFDTNVFGLLTVTRAVLPTLRAQGSGHIVTMSSSAGFAVSAGRGLYGASKFAVEAISEALRGELAPLGIRVTVVEPGSFRTGFLTPESRRSAGVGIDAYAGSVGALLTAIAANNGRQPGDPAKAAQAILTAVAAEEPPFRLPLGRDAVTLIESKLDAVRADLDRWRSLSLSTDVDTE